MALVAASVVALMIVGLFVVAAQADQKSRTRVEMVVRQGFASYVDSMAARMQVNWDDAVANLALQFNPGWAHDNIGESLGGAERLDAAIVLNARDVPIYGWGANSTVAKSRAATWAGGDIGRAASAPFVQAAAPAVAKVRAAERARGLLTGRRSTNGKMAESIYVGEVREVQGAPYILTASLVQPDFGRTLPGPRSAIVVTARKIDQAMLDDFAPHYLLSDMAFRQSPMPRMAYISLDDPDGQSLGALQWRPNNPGAAILDAMLPALLAMSLALGAAIAVMWRRAVRAARGLLASEARAKHMAGHDTLTGLANRALFLDHLALALQDSRRSGRTVAVLCIDLDRFKQVNDTFGHQCGDELICEAAKRLASTCRAGETVARLGGDEFAVVIPDASPESAALLADRIQRAASGSVDISAGRVILGCSIGIAVLRDADVDSAEVLRQADLALYQAKDRGRGCSCFFEPEMDAALRARREIEADLRDAVANHTLTMVYQPQVNETGEVVALEALARWSHPVRGEVSPAVFVPIAEECGLIDLLSFQTLRIAFTDSLRWPGIRMAVNLSASQLRRHDFFGRLRALLYETGVEPRQIELEITEGVLLGDDLQTHEALNSLRTMGFSLALDDFGTGYSSLSYLRRYPVNRIKIDRSFISNLGVERTAWEMVAAIVRLARALGLGIIAEGVETPEQRSRLILAGCVDMQGYLFGRPTDAENVDAMLVVSARRA
jgi:diguanylate cyclase (GGDEF)-like protein